MLLQFWVLFAVALAGSVATGFLVISLSGMGWYLRAPYTRLFAAFVVGSWCIAVATAAVFTLGRSVLLLALIPGMALRLFSFSGPVGANAVWRIPRSAVAGAGLAASLLFGHQAIGKVNFARGPLGIHMPHPDTLFYARVARAATVTGNESIYAYDPLLSSDFAGATPYHFFELWLTAGFARLLRQGEVHTLVLLVTPLLRMGVLLGLWAITEASRTRQRALRALALGWMFLPGLRVESFDQIPLLAEANQFALPFLVSWSARMPPIHIHFLAALLWLLRGRILLAASALLLTVPASAIGAPAVIIGVVLTALAGQVGLRHLRWRRELRQALVLTCVLVSALVIFYAVFGNDRLRFTSMSAVVAGNFDPAAWRTKVNIVLKGLLQIGVVLFLPLAAVALLLLRLRSSRGALLSAVACGSCLVGGLLGFAVASDQLLSLVFGTVPVPAAVYCLLFTLVVLGERRRLFAGTVWAALLVVGLFWVIRGNWLEWQDNRTIASGEDVAYAHRYSRSYLEQISRTLPDSPLGAYFVSPDDVGVHWDTRKPVPTFFPPTYPLGAYLAFFPQYYTATFLGDPEPWARHRISETVVFLRYEQDEARRGWTVPASSQRRFIEEKRLSFVLATEKAAVPDWLLARVRTVIRDEATGERFMLLGRPEPH